MPFSRRSVDFLIENILHDSREWYAEHKAEYREVVTVPMTELMEALRPTLAKIDERIECDTRRISRIYRDARYIRGGSMFRDNVWCSFAWGRGTCDCPVELYFDFSPEGYSYGVGWYNTPPSVVSALRQLIKERTPSFIAAKKAFEQQKVFEMGGDIYKRDRFPDDPADVKLWLNRRSIYFHRDSADWELFCSDRLAQQVAQDFMLIAPVVRFLGECQEREIMNRLD